MSTGFIMQSAYVEQSDITVTPNTGWKGLPNISNTLNTTTNTTESEILNNGRIQSSGMVTGGEITGDIESELMFGTFDDLMAAAFWNEWTEADTESGTNSQLTIGKKRKFFAMTKDFDDHSAHYIWKGVHVNTMNLDISVDNIIKVTFGLMGLGYDSRKTTSFAKSPEAAVDKQKASGLSIGDILIDDSPIAVCVEAFSLTLDNQAMVQKCLGKSEIYGGNIHALIASATGSMTLAFGEQAYEILEMQRTGGIMSVKLPIRFEDGSGYDITLPEVQIEGDIPSPSGTELPTAEVSFKPRYVQ